MHSLRWRQWVNSFLDVVMMDWSVAQMHGSRQLKLGKKLMSVLERDIRVWPGEGEEGGHFVKSVNV